MVNQYMSAVKILQDEDLPHNALEVDEADGDIAAVVLKECPEYRIVEPIFRGMDLRHVASKDWTTGDDSDYSNGGSATKRAKRKAVKAGSGSHGRKRRRRSRPAASEDAPARWTVRDEGHGQDAATDTKSTGTGVFAQSEAVSSPRRSIARGSAASDGATAELERKIAACRLEHVEQLCELHLATAQQKEKCEVHVARCRLQAEQHRVELEQRLDDLKMETERRRQEMQLQAERRQLELKLKVDTLQSRQSLKHRRIPKADIDLLLPLSALQSDP